MSDATIDQFIADLRTDPRFARHAQAIEDALFALDAEGDGNASASGLYEAVHYVLARPDRLLREKIEMVHRLITRRGRQSGTIAQIVGW
jgi:hypothetical protein